MKSRYWIIAWCVLICSTFVLQGCPSESDQLRKNNANLQAELDKKREKMAAFINSEKEKGDKVYRTKYKKLLQTYKARIADQSDSTTDLYLYGFLLVNPKDKWKQFHACLRLQPTHYWCRIGRGKIYSKWKIKDRAEKDFRAALKQRPGRLEPLLGLAEVAMLRRQDEKAVQFYKSVLAKQSSNQDALFGLAILHRRQGKKEKAIHYYQELLKHQPKHFEALRAVGNLFYKQKKMRPAAEAYNRAIQIRPRHFRLLVRLATISEVHLGQSDRALTLYERASVLPQSHFHTYYRLGILRGQKGQVQKGIESLLQALRLQNEHPGALLGLGKLYLRKSDAKNAVNTLWKALRLSNGKISVRISLAKALELKGDFAGVLRQYEQIIKLDPKRTDIKQSMQNMLKKIGLSNESFGGRSAAQVFNKGRRRVYNCYKARLKTHPKLKGQVSIKLIVNPTGTVDRVTILIDKTTLEDNLVHACVKWTYRRAIFPRLARKKRYQIKSILKFSKP